MMDKPKPRFAIPDFLQKVEDAAEVVRGKLRVANIPGPPTAGLILGTGMGKIVDHVESPFAIPYESIPGFSESSVRGHVGELVFGKLNGRSLVAMSGRFHFYEGYDHAEICLPVALIQALGADKLVIGNAAGGINPTFKQGEVMLIDDHLDLFFRPNRSTTPVAAHSIPPRGPGCERNIYSRDLISAGLEAARQHGFVVHRGVYAALTGPNYETRSEYRMLKTIGADAVGMSTIPEALIARQLGMEVCGLSTVTNVATPDLASFTSHQEVIDAVHRAEPVLVELVRNLII